MCIEMLLNLITPLASPGFKIYFKKSAVVLIGLSFEVT